MIFDLDKILEIQQKAITSGLHKKRNLMLLGINGKYVAGLDEIDNQADQLLSDLNAMSEAGTIVGGQVPLERWLRNAANATAVFPDRQSYFVGLADVVKAAANSGPGLQSATGGPIEQRKSFAGVGGEADPAPGDRSDSPSVPNPAPGDRPDQGTNPRRFSGFQLPDIAITLSPLLVLTGAVILRVTAIKGWEVLSPIATTFAVWSLLRLWRADATILAPAVPASSDPQHETLQVGMLLVIFSIAASGLILQLS
jgi:hypothetical protein